jgi:hypothetical protein
MWSPDDPERGRHTPDADDPAYWPPVKGCNHPGHGCGFYCARTATHLIEVGYAGAITAKVELAGKIIPAVNGFRAQKMRLETFNVPYERWREVDAIKAAYPDVEVELASPMLPDKATLPEWCPKCGSRWSGRSATCGFCGYHHR